MLSLWRVGLAESCNLSVKKAPKETERRVLGSPDEHGAVEEAVSFLARRFGQQATSVAGRKIRVVGSLSFALNAHWV